MADLDAQLQPLLGEVATPEEAGEAEAEAEPGRAGRLARLAVLSAGVAGAVQAVQERDQALDAAVAQAAELQTQIDALTKAKAAMEASLSERTQEAEALNAQLSEAQSSLESVEAERASLQVSLESQEVELQDARQQLEALQGQATISTDEWEATRAQLESRTAEVTSLQGELSQATALFSVAPAVADVAKWFAELPPIKREAANAAIAEGVLPHRTKAVQKLSTVHGIGKVFEQRLYENGIGTFWEVAHLGGERVQPLFQLTDWQMMRLNMEEMRGDAYRLARETGTVGAIWEQIEVDDFEAIPGIGKVYERRLYEAGIRTYADIAGATVEQLAEICHAPEFRTPDYAAWIQRASELVEQAAAVAPAEP
jgi:predicted flap endonuclease-1-like 5' DNA nuclease